MVRDPSIGEQPESDRVERVFREAEEVRVDLIGPRDLDQIEVGFPVDGGFGGCGRKTGRAEKARPACDDDLGYDERAEPFQILSLSLPSLYGQAAAPLDDVEVMAFANSA